MVRYALWPILGLLLAGAPLLAHHSFAAEFDGKKPVTLNGVVTKVEWQNPHTYFYVNVKDESGRLINWALESAGPQTLLKRGWNKDSLKVGDKITVLGYCARGGAKVAAARAVVLPDGRKVNAAPAGDGGPEAR